MKMLSGKSWAYLIGGAAGAFVLSVAGGAWSADLDTDLKTPPAQELAPPGAQPATPPAPQTATPPAAQPAAPQAGTPELGKPAAGNTEPAEAVSRTTESSVTVTAIDRGARRVTLKDPAGEKYVVSVPKDLKGFDAVKVGDRIDIDYYESVAVSIAPPGTKPGESETMARAPMGEGGEAIGKSLTVSAKVVNVDAEAHEVTFKGPRGENKTVKVQDPDLQKKLPDLKAGDAVQLTYTEATAAAIRPAANAK